jgi:hypothetical protein
MGTHVGGIGERKTCTHPHTYTENVRIYEGDLNVDVR